MIIVCVTLLAYSFQPFHSITQLTISKQYHYQLYILKFFNDTVRA